MKIPGVADLNETDAEQLRVFLDWLIEQQKSKVGETPHGN